MNSARRTAIRAGHIIAFDGRGHRHLRDGVVVIEGDHILHVGPRFDGAVDETVDAADRVLTPGLISTHAHIGGSPLDRSFLEDRGNPQFWYSGLFEMLPVRHEAQDEEAGRACVDFSMAELLRGGVTTVMGSGRTRATAERRPSRPLSGLRLSPRRFSRRGSPSVYRQGLPSVRRQLQEPACNSPAQLGQKRKPKQAKSKNGMGFQQQEDGVTVTRNRPDGEESFDFLGLAELAHRCSVVTVHRVHNDAVAGSLARHIFVPERRRGLADRMKVSQTAHDDKEPRTDFLDEPDIAVENRNRQYAKREQEEETLEAIEFLGDSPGEAVPEDHDPRVEMECGINTEQVSQAAHGPHISWARFHRNCAPAPPLIEHAFERTCGK